ncbi:MAG: oxidoreductase, partial [Mycobacterium sp.]|nr:oxidoreductase [Mycobacterium sp.]
VAAWSPLGGGLLTGKYRTGTGGRLTEWQGTLLHSEDDARKVATVDAVIAASEDLGVPAAQVAVAWLLERAILPATLGGDGGTFRRHPVPIA